MKDRFIIVEGEQYDQALEEALLQLALTRDQVAVDVLEERKAFLFKKAYVKLKVAPLEKLMPEAVVAQSDQPVPEENPFQPLIYQEKPIVRPYELIYKPDGVYLIVHSMVENPYQLIEEIREYAEKKQVEDVLLTSISAAVKKTRELCYIAPAQSEKFIDSEIKIEISRDKMEASLHITRAEGGKEFTAEEIMEALRQANVIYGINEPRVKQIAEMKYTNGFVLIALGKAPVNGVDGKIVYHFDPEQTVKPVVEEDGTVNFKELNIIKNVTRGELLVEVYPPTEGVPGIDVCGNEIPAKKGKEIRIKAGKNTEESEDKTKLFAATDGQILIDNGKISVSEVYHIRGDVDNSTGNVQFNGTVIINGNVKSGFTVQAQGNIEVHGVVEGATLIAGGNITVNRGVQGNNQAKLICEGDLTVKYIENATVNCRGSVRAEVILHSEVVAKGKILLQGKKGLIAGGDLKAGEEIRAKTIGSHMGTVTKLEVGLDPEERNRHDEMKASLAEIDRNIDNLKKTIELLKRANQGGQMPKNKEEMLIKSLKTYEFLKEKEAKLRLELQFAEEKLSNLMKGKIHASNIIYPGVKVVILNSTRFIYDELVNCTLYRKDGEVTIGPYEH